MKRFIVVLALGTLVLCSSRAWAQPAAVPRMAQVPRDSRQTFATVKQYFSNPGSTMFRLVSADPRMGTIVARRDNIDNETWNEWAYCKLSPMHLLDTLQDGTATVNVKVEPSGNSSYVTVNADFEGTYGLADSSDTTQCISNGVLEKNILAAVGAQQSASQ